MICGGGICSSGFHGKGFIHSKTAEGWNTSRHFSTTHRTLALFYHSQNICTSRTCNTDYTSARINNFFLNKDNKFSSYTRTVERVVYMLCSLPPCHDTLTERNILHGHYFFFSIYSEFKTMRRKESSDEFRMNESIQEFTRVLKKIFTFVTVLLSS